MSLKTICMRYLKCNSISPMNDIDLPNAHVSGPSLKASFLLKKANLHSAKLKHKKRTCNVTEPYIASKISNNFIAVEHIDRNIPA